MIVVSELILEKEMSVEKLISPIIPPIYSTVLGLPWILILVSVELFVIV